MSVLVALLELSVIRDVRYLDKRGRVEAERRKRENNGVRNESSSGVGGHETEICTNLRLLVMSGDKLHRQKESAVGGWGGRDGEIL